MKVPEMNVLSHRPPRFSVPPSRRRCLALPGGIEPTTWSGSWARGSRPASCDCHGGSLNHQAARRPRAEASGRGRCGSRRLPSAPRASGGDGLHPCLCDNEGQETLGDTEWGADSDLNIKAWGGASRISFYIASKLLNICCLCFLFVFNYFMSMFDYIWLPNHLVNGLKKQYTN